MRGGDMFVATQERNLGNDTSGPGAGPPAEGGLKGVLLRWTVGEPRPTVLVPEGRAWQGDGPDSGAGNNSVPIPDALLGDPSRNFDPAGIRVRAQCIVTRRMDVARCARGVVNYPVEIVSVA